MATRTDAPADPQASSRADSLPAQLGPIADPRGEGARGEARQRRALEGWLVGRMRTQARRRRRGAQNDRPPGGSRRAGSTTGGGS